MKLRELLPEDASLMLEWMHDEDVVRWLNADFASKTIQDCEEFIKCSKNNDENLHLAVVNDSNEYMGTVSLKHIDKNNGSAEFAITVRKEAMGQGYSSYGMKEILRIGLNELNLQKIFWCVSEENARAVKFYDKNGYQRTQDVPATLLDKYSEELLKQFIWYAVENKKGV